MALRKPALDSPGLRDRCGALYEYNATGANKLAPLTSTFHRIRCALLILLLVASRSHPTAQSLLYLMSALIGFVWDFRVRPCSGTTSKAQATVLNVTKVLAGILSLSPAMSLAAIATIAAGVGVGMGLACVQVAREAWRTAALRKQLETDPAVRVTTNPPSDSSSLDQNSVKVRR